MRVPAICIAAIVLALVVGCASGPGSNSAQRKAHKNLDRGSCPSFIIYRGARSEFGRQRYGVTDTELSAYRDRELANCQAKLEAGDTEALRVLVEYWTVKKNSRLVARTYKTYMENGSDVTVLAKSSATLANMYAIGERGLPLDTAAAFYYLGLAVEYGGGEYELPYANALYARGSYADAYSYYQKMIAEGASSGGLGQEDICEINLKLADMYFRGRGVRENWYIGYYYWLEGLSTAGDPRWGSCVSDSFVYRDRNAIETERKKAVDRRLGLLGPSELARVKAAWETPEAKGLPYISSLNFRRPPLAIKDHSPPRPTAGKNNSSQRQSNGAVRLPPWKPLSGGICLMRPGGGRLNWSEVFQLRSGAIWAVNSMADKSTSVGSAVAISPNRLITNCHLIQASSGVKLLQGGKSVHADVIAADRPGDRCILQTAEPLYPYVASARQQGGLMIGEDVATIGNPKGLDTSLSRGIVAQKRDKNGRAYIQTDAAISSGSSGGGLFDASGNLIGITTFKVTTGESLNFAIAIDEFCRM